MLYRKVGVLRRLAMWCAGLSVVLLGPSPAWSQQKLETPQEANDRIRQLALAAQSKPGEYILGTGDLLRIEVFDVPELTREVRVNESGVIALPLLPVKVHASGLTAFQLEEKLTELLQVHGLVLHPQVTATVKEQRSQPITVFGAVRRPLVYQALRKTTLLEVLSEAGGIADDAGSTVIITRGGKDSPASEATPSPENGAADGSKSQTIVISISDLLDTADPKYNIRVMGGDVIHVPRAGIVYVVGAVDRPGGFVLANDHQDMTALRVLALAGGYKGSARPHDAVILRTSPATGQREEVGVDLAKVVQRKTEDVRLLPNDILFVPESGSRKALRRTGEIALGLVSGVALFRLTR